MLRIKTVLAAAVTMAWLAGITSAAVFNGNGATGFGGTVGTGSLAITDNAAGMTVTFNRGSSGLDNDLVVYLDTQAGGFLDNSTFADNGDGGRTAISGANTGNPSLSVVQFPAGFGAEYAMSIQNNFIGIFQLASGGNNSFTYLFGTSQSGNDSDASYTLNITPAQMAQIGLTASSGQTFGFVGTYISTSAYRSNETIGSSTVVPDGNAGFSGTEVFTGGNSYTLSVVPEPASIGLIGLGLTALAARRRSVR